MISVVTGYRQLLSIFDKAYAYVYIYMYKIWLKNEMYKTRCIKPTYFRLFTHILRGYYMCISRDVLWSFNHMTYAKMRN